MSKLKEERSSYLEYQKVIRELEHLNKLYVAWQYICAEVRELEHLNKLYVAWQYICAEVRDLEHLNKLYVA